MDATTLILQSINPERLLEHYDFDRVSHDGDMIRSCCKLHGGSNPSAFVMNNETGLWYCHTGGCGGGDAFTLVQRLEGISFPAAVEWLAAFFGVDITNMKVVERKSAHQKELRQWIDAMKARKRVIHTEYRIPAEVREVAKFRSFKEETLRHFELGWVAEIEVQNREGKPYTIRNRLVFPIYQNGVRVGASYRRVKPTDTPKWSHQPPLIQTKHLLYNYDNVLGAPEIIVVEGLPDVWAYHEIGVPAVATFGAHLTDEQYKMLMRTGADLTFSYDGDEAGFVATRKAHELLHNKANLRIIKFEPGEDPENIPREELKERYAKRERLHVPPSF